MLVEDICDSRFEKRDRCRVSKQVFKAENGDRKG